MPDLRVILIVSVFCLYKNVLVLVRKKSNEWQLKQSFEKNLLLGQYKEIKSKKRKGFISKMLELNFFLKLVKVLVLNWETIKLLLVFKIIKSKENFIKTSLIVLKFSL